MSTDKFNEYRRYSEEAEKQAERALREEDRASWLRIAQSWLRLIPARRMSSQEAIDATRDEGRP